MCLSCLVMVVSMVVLLSVECLNHIYTYIYIVDVLVWECTGLSRALVLTNNPIALEKADRRHVSQDKHLTTTRRTIVDTPLC